MVSFDFPAAMGCGCPRQDKLHLKSPGNPAGAFHFLDADSADALCPCRYAAETSARERSRNAGALERTPVG